MNAPSRLKQYSVPGLLASIVDSALGIGYLTCAIVRIKSLIPKKEVSDWLKLTKILARTILPSPLQQQQRPQQL